MKYWLMKSEPEEFSWDDLYGDVNQTEPWTGVRNHQAANNMRGMREGDLAFFYHSGKPREIVGIMEVVKEAYPDPTDTLGKFVCVDVKAIKPLDTPVTIDDVKQRKTLSEMVLINNSRLSVQPVTKKEWDMIVRMGTNETK